MFLMKNLHIVSMALFIFMLFVIIIRQARFIDRLMTGRLPMMAADFDGDVILIPPKKKRILTSILGYDHPSLYKYKVKVKKPTILHRIWTKEFKKVIYEKTFTQRADYGFNRFHDIDGYIRFYVNWSLRYGLRFNTETPNYSQSSRRLLRGLFGVLEYAVNGMSRYERIKEDLRNQDLWNKIDPDFGYIVNKDSAGLYHRYPKPKTPKRKQDKTTFIIGETNQPTILQISRSNAYVEVICTPRENSEILGFTKDVFHFPNFGNDERQFPVILGDNTCKPYFHADRDKIDPQ